MKKDLLKISEVSERSGVSITTIKYYIAKGLISCEKKTSHNMSWYNPNVVDRVIRIKHLQKDYFYPLKIIKQKLEEEEIVTGKKEDLKAAVFRHYPRFQERTVTSDETSQITGLSPDKIQKAVDCGIVILVDGGFSSNDLEILGLIKEREQAGLGIDHTLDAFLSYKEAIKKAAQKDIDSMITKGFLHRKFTNNEILKMVRVNNYSLDRYVQLERSHSGLKESVHRLEQFRKYAESFTEYFYSVVVPVYGAKNVKNLLENSKLKDVIEGFKSMINFNNIPNVVEVVRFSFNFFENIDFNKINDKVERGLLASISLGFYYLLPENYFDKNKINFILSNFCFDQRIYKYLNIGEPE